MNYRHHFHAGNFADLLKHAVVLHILQTLKADGRPIRVVDTHAGAGVYDLGDDMAQKSGEAKSGILRLMEAERIPALLAPLVAYVRSQNSAGPIRTYPGSPHIICGYLGAVDSYLGCELRPDDYNVLRGTLSRFGTRGRVASFADGYATAKSLASYSQGNTFILIDPPFERGDEYACVLEATQALLRLRPRPIIAIWAPIKDLETFDGLLRDIESLRPPPTWVVQSRVRGLENPLRLNGSAMIVIGATLDVAKVHEAADWIALALGGQCAKGACLPL